MDAGRTRVAVIGGGIAGPVAAPAWHRGRLVLAQCLRDLPDHQQAFRRYQQLRRQRVKKIFDAAVRTNSTMAAGPVGPPAGRHA